MIIWLRNQSKVRYRTFQLRFAQDSRKSIRMSVRGSIAGGAARASLARRGTRVKAAVKVKKNKEKKEKKVKKAKKEKKEEDEPPSSNPSSRKAAAG